MPTLPTTPSAFVELGAKIYRERYQEDFEKEHVGQFVAIELQSEQAFVGDTPERALRIGHEKTPDGMFHLIRVGHAGAYRVSYSSNASSDWLAQ